MSPREAAESTGINKLTILRWIKTGRLVAEEIKTANGPGYDIRPEDLTQAIQKPRKKRDVTPTPAKGSVVAELQAMRGLIEAQALEAKAREDRLQREIHDLRGQLHQTEERLTEVLRALPAPTKPEAGNPIQALLRWLRRDR